VNERGRYRRSIRSMRKSRRKYTSKPIKMDVTTALTKITIAVFLAAVATSFLPSMAAAQVLVYSAKFLCGTMVGPDEATPERESAVKPGNYATAINVHNFASKDAKFIKMAVLADTQQKRQKAEEAQPPQEVGRKVSARDDEYLAAGDALEIDCPDIVTLFNGTRFEGFIKEVKFIKGFVVIESEVELNVVAVYSASVVRGRWLSLGAGMGLDVEYVSPKRKQ